MFTSPAAVLVYQSAIVSTTVYSTNNSFSYQQQFLVPTTASHTGSGFNALASFLTDSATNTLTDYYVN